MSAEHLTPERRRSVIEACVTAPTFKKAAALAGVTQRTLCRYYSDPDFKADVSAVRAEMREATRLSKVQAIRAGWDALRAIFDAEDASPFLVLKAIDRLKSWEEGNRKWEIEKAVVELQAAVARLHSAGSTSPEACSAGGATSTPPNVLA